MEERPLIFVTNDDGINSAGIRTLINVMRAIGRVVVVAPDKPQSGTGHAITIQVPLRLHCLVSEDGYEEYSCNGTPVDCVKLGFKVVMKRRPDILVSGVNHGSNASVNIIYSGTIAAVLEGAMSGVPSIGFSLLNYNADADFQASVKYIRQITETVLEKGLPEGICLNVNIPDVKEEEIRGIVACKQANGTWQEDFDERTDPVGRKYYWLKGVYAKIGNGEDTDECALENNYISVVPVQFDLTAHNSIQLLLSWGYHV
jgi:5'-nucleotidase